MNFSYKTIGDSQFASLLMNTIGDRLYRFVNRNDVIPRLPLGIPYWLVKRLLKVTTREGDEVHSSVFLHSPPVLIHSAADLSYRSLI